MKDIFYQSSLPRSGSTLLQNIIGQNPDFYVTPTSGVLELVFGARNNFSNSLEFKAQDSVLMEKAFKGFCRSGVRSFFESISDKPYVLDKSRGWVGYMDFLKFYHDNPKIICMIRDPRAIFSSMEKNFRKHQHFDVGVQDKEGNDGVTTEKRIRIWSDTPPIGLAMERLQQALLEGKSHHICFVKYEDLTEQPQVELARIYEYLGIDYFDHDFTDVQQITEEDDVVYGVFGDHLVRPVLHTNPDDYTEILGVNMSNRIKNEYSWFYEYFNYK
jgi:sulfotransferase